MNKDQLPDDTFNALSRMAKDLKAKIHSKLKRGSASDDPELREELTELEWLHRILAHEDRHGNDDCND